MSDSSFYSNTGTTSAAISSITNLNNEATASKNAAATSAATATASKDAAVVAKDAAVVAQNAAQAAAGGVSGALSIANNLSDVANASTARTNLGVAIGSNVQAYSSTLQSTTAAYTSALNTKLSGIEASATADQTKSDIDALGINATQVSGFTVGKSVPSNAVFTDTNTTYSVGDGGLTQINFTNADHTKLNSIEASADVTDTQNVVGALTAGTNITIASDGTIASTASGGSSYNHPNHSGEVTSTGDGATVIASNVVDADNLKVSGNGSNTQFLRSDGDGTFTWATPVDTNTTYSVGDGGLTTNDFTNSDHSKLDGIEALADVTDTANVTAAGALMDSEVTNLAQVKAFAASDYATSAQGTLATNALPKSGGAMTGAITTNSTFDGRDVATDGTKLDGIAASANNYSHPNHSGEVTSSGDGATVIADNVVDEANLKVSNTPTNGYVLTAQSGNTGGLTWAAAASGGGADLYAANETSATQPSATGTNSIAIGDSAVSTGTRSFAGPKSRATGNDSVSFGITSNSSSYGASGVSSFAAGEHAKASQYYAISLGYQSQSSGYGSFAAGFDLCKATGNVSVALGKGFASASGAVAIGHAGYYTQPAASANGAIAIGDGVTASGLRAIGLGQNSTVSHEESVIIGTGITSTATNQVNIGGSTQDVRISEVYTLPKVDGSNGHVLTSNGSGTVSWAAASSGGGGADLYASNESSPSAQPSATGTNSIAIGDSAVSTSTSSFAGPRTRATGADSVAFAQGSSSTSNGAQNAFAVAMGQTTRASGRHGIALGFVNQATALQSYCIGKGNQATHSQSYVFGGDISSTASNQVSIGGTQDDVRISETYTLPKVDATASGQVLTSNASGVVSWATAGGGAMNLISTSTFSSAVSSIDFTSLGSYSRWRIIGNIATASHGINHTLKIFDNGTIVSSSSYTYIKDSKATNQTPVSTTSYGWSTNEGINKSSFIFDIEMVGGRPYIKMQGHGQSSGASSHMREFQTWGTLDDSYSLTSLTGLRVSGRDPFGGTVTLNSGKISIYGISS